MDYGLYEGRPRQNVFRVYLPVKRQEDYVRGSDCGK
jgi:hypothetical protein